MLCLHYCLKKHSNSNRVVLSVWSGHLLPVPAWALQVLRLPPIVQRRAHSGYLAAPNGLRVWEWVGRLFVSPCWLCIELAVACTSPSRHHSWDRLQHPRDPQSRLSGDRKLDWWINTILPLHSKTNHVFRLSSLILVAYLILFNQIYFMWFYFIWFNLFSFFYAFNYILEANFVLTSDVKCIIIVFVVVIIDNN